MFRRSRFSIRPNVVATGRTAPAAQEAPVANQEASETSKDVSESSTAAAATESGVTPSEKPTAPVPAPAPGDDNDQNGEGTSSSAAVQRRKRFSIKPKVAPGRTATLGRTAKSPVKAVSATALEAPVSDLGKPATSSQTGTTAAPQRLSEESKQPKEQPKPTLIPSDSSEPPAAPTAEDSPTQVCVSFSRAKPVDSGKELESTPSCQVEVPSPPGKAHPSLPDKEAIEISEKARTLVSSQRGLSLSPPAFSLSRLLNDPSDLQRLAKARKLRELLKQEMHKDKKIKKASMRTKEYSLDPAKMTMRDLIHYLPLSNPMTSLEDLAQENETVVPPAPAREESPETAQQPQVLPKIASPREEEEEEAEADEEEDEGMMVPQVKVAEDGSLIIDEESLTVEVQRAKGPNPAQDRDPIFERGSTTTYSSFRKGTYSKPWSNEETDMFFLAISMVGTDFSMICQLFPHRARSEIKNKFKKEERENSWRIDKAFRERRRLDIEYFSKLLEKILEVQKNKKKLKSLAGKSQQKRKAKGKKAARKLSVVEEEDEEEQNEIPEEEGEKENEDLCNERGTTVTKPKKKRKRKEASTGEPSGKKNKAREKRSEQDEAHIPEDTEAALPEDGPTTDMSEKPESVNEAKAAAIKPAKLSRGRAAKPLLPLGRKRGKKALPPSTMSSDTVSDRGDESVIEEASEQQVDKDASPSRQTSQMKSANDDSEEEEAAVKPLRPTRYGRVPKPTKPLNYPAKEAASEATPASPAGSTASARPKPKCTAKKRRSVKQQSAQESKKPKLVTLRASQSEYSDEEDGMQQEEEVEEEEHPECSSSKDSTAPVFVPASLRSPHPVISEVEETMEELDILANMPDVLGMSQDALCPDASCEQAQNETGTVEPCEHQLDLLVDVIDFLSADHTEVSEEASYNEAAQTLLTIGNLAHLSQSAQNQIATQDYTTGTPVSENETRQQLEEEFASTPAAPEENGTTPQMSVTSVSETSETVALQNITTNNNIIPVIQSSDQRTDSVDPTPQLPSNPESSKVNYPQTRRGRSFMVKPKPNLGQPSRNAQSKSLPETSTVRTAEESHAVAPDLSQTTDTAAEETPRIADCSRTLLKDETSCIGVSHTEEASDSHKRSDAAASDQSTSEIQSNSFSEAQFQLGLQQARDLCSTSGTTIEVLISHVGMSESSCSNLLTPDVADRELQTGQGSNVASAPVQESSSHPAPSVTPVPKFPLSQEEESKVGSTCQTRKSRFQKVKPKVNLAQTSRTARPQPQTTEDTVEKDSNPIPNPQSHEKTILEVDAQPDRTSPENLNQSPALNLMPSLDLGSTLIPLEELSVTPEKKTDVGVVGRVESGAATSEQKASENQNLSEFQFEPNSEQATSAIDSASVQESSSHPAPSVTSFEKIPVSHEEESKGGSPCQTRKSRFQKVKPKVNLAQTSRTLRPKPQTTKDTTEKDSNPTPNLKFSEKAVVEVDAQPDCTTSPENLKQSPALNVMPPLDLGSTLISLEEMSVTPEKKTDVGVVGQVESGLATSEQRVSENQNLSEFQFEPNSEQATSAIDSARVQESSNHPAPSVAPVEKIPVSQEEESTAGSPCQTRKSRFQKVKPKVNLAQTSRTLRPKPQTTEDTTEKDSNPTPNLKFHEKAIVKVDAQPDRTTSLENLNQSPALNVIPPLHLGSTLIPLEEMSVTPEKKTDVGVVGQVESGLATSEQRVSENQNLSEFQFEPNSQQATSAIDSAPVQESSNHPAPSVAPAEKIPVSQEEESTAGSPCQTRKSRFQKVKPKVNLAQTSRTLRPKPQTTKDTTEKDSNPTPNLKFSEKAVLEVDAQPDCTTSPENLKQSPALNVMPPLDLGSTLIPLEEMSVTPEKKTDVGVVGQVESGLATSEQRVSENQNLSEFQFEPNSEQATSAIDSAPVQESSNHPALSVAPAEKIPVSQEEESKGGSTCQTRKSRFQKVKPKVNLAQTSRTLRPKPQTTEDTTEKDSNPTPNLKFHEKAIVKVDAQPDRTTSPENLNQSPALNLMSSLDLGSTLIPLEEMSVTPEKKADIGVVGQVELGAATSEQKASENQNLSEFQFEPNSEQATSAIDSAPVQKSSNHPALSVAPAEKIPVSQEEESKVRSTCQTGKSRFQKVKPKVNLAQTSRTAHPKPQTTKDTIEKDSNTTPNPQFHEKAIEVEAEPTCTTSPEKPSPASDLKPSREQAIRNAMPTSDSKDDVLMSLVGKSESNCNDPLISDLAGTEPQIGQGSNLDSAPVQESSGSSTSVTPVEEFPVSQEEEVKAKSTCPNTRGRFQKIKPKPNLPQMSRIVRTKPQTTKDPVTPMQFVETLSSTTSRLESTENTIAEGEAQPSCSTMSSEKPSQITSASSLETRSTHKTTEELLSTEEQKTDDGSEGLEQSVPQRRRHFPKVKPNLGSSSRTPRTKLPSNDVSLPSEHCHMDTSLTSDQPPLDNENSQTEQEVTDSQPLTSERTDLVKIGPTECTLVMTNNVFIATPWVAVNQDSFLENMSDEKNTDEGESTGDKMSNKDTVEVIPASPRDCKQDMFISATQTNTQLTADPAAVSHLSSEDGSTESVLAPSAHSTPLPKRTLQQRSESQDGPQQSSESNPTAVLSTADNQSEPTNPSSRAAPQTRRGRLIKPKPRLGRSSRPSQPQEVQNTKQVEAVCHQPVPLEGAIEQCKELSSFANDAPSSPGCLTQDVQQVVQQDHVPNDAASSLGLVTQVADNCTQDASTSSTGGTQSHPSVTVFPDMLSQQDPSDPNETFFILSLTEIPVCPSGEIVASVPEPPPYLPVTDASTEQHSAAGESLAAAGDGSLLNVSAPVSMEEIVATGIINVKDTGPDPTSCTGSIMESPVDPHVHPEKNIESETPPTTQLQKGTSRKAKVQAKANTTRRKQASKTPNAKEAESVPIQTNTSQHSEPKALDDAVTEPRTGSGDHVHVEKDPEEGSSGAQTTRTRGTRSSNRKAKGIMSDTNSTAPASDSPPGKAASKGPKVRAPRAAGKRPAPPAVASTSHLAEETPSASSTTSRRHPEVDVDQTSEQSRLSPGASPCPAEVSASPHTDCMEEEPTSVSQYFLSDIFTEVEET